MTFRSMVTLAMAKVVRPGLLSNYRSMVGCEKMSDERLRELQLIKLKHLLQHHLLSSSYCDFCQLEPGNININAIDDFKKIPVVSKEYLRGYFKNTINKQPDFRANSTSGSSGQNLKFYQCSGMHDASSAAVRYCTQFSGFNPWGARTIGIWGNSPEVDWKTVITHTAKRFLLNTSLLQGYGLDEEKALLYLKKIRECKPQLLYGYPSYLHLLAHVGRVNKITAPEVGAVICSGEQCQSHHREEIEAYFGKRIFNRYGSREFSVIAHETDEHNCMYVPPTRFILETDINGELLVTDLDNYATPFIRYAIGDFAEIHSAQELLGSPGQCITAINGRTHDTLSTPSGKLVSGQFLTVLTKKIPGIVEFQYVQTGKSKIELRLVKSSDYDSEREHELIDYFAKSLGSEMSLAIVHTEKIERTSMGKRRFIIRQETPCA